LYCFVSSSVVILRRTKWKLYWFWKKYI
jgi:hypothetical protein